MAFEDLAPLRAGDAAPDFTLPNQFGEDVTLSALAADKPVVVAFVPLAFTATCTGEVCELRDNIALFRNADVHLVVVSCDSKATLREWGEREGLDFPLLSDFWPHGAVSTEYGVFLEDKGFAARATFVVDRELTVRAAFVNPPSQARPLEAYREALATL